MLGGKRTIFPSLLFSPIIFFLSLLLFRVIKNSSNIKNLSTRFSFLSIFGITWNNFFLCSINLFFVRDRIWRISDFSTRIPSNGVWILQCFPCDRIMLKFTQNLISAVLHLALLSAFLSNQISINYNSAFIFSSHFFVSLILHFFFVKISINNVIKFNL